MSGGWKRAGLSTALLIVVVLLLAVAASMLAGVIVGPNVFLPVVLGILVFVGIQLAIFRALGLRSDADREGDDGEATDEADWRG